MSTPIGTFQVRADAKDVVAFRQATGVADRGPTLPFTYPICWMVTTEVRAGILALVTEPDMVLFHESQTFAYERPLECDRAYELALTARRETAPDRLLIDGTIRDAEGTAATVEAILRLFSMKAVAAA